MTGNPENRRGRRVAHAVWAILALAASVALVYGGRRGHPPGIVLLPLLLLVWAVGHVAIWVVGWLAVKGERLARGAEGAGRSWPLGLRLALAGTGVAAAVGTLQVVVTGSQGRLYPYPDRSLWTIMLVIWAVHGACFVGLLLRRPWSRVLSTLLAFAWALLMASQVAEQLARGNVVDPAVWLVAGSMVGLIVLGLHLGTSRRVRSFLRD
jgi:hypothetical protein